MNRLVEVVVVYGWVQKPSLRALHWFILLWHCSTDWWKRGISNKRMTHNSVERRCAVNGKEVQLNETEPQPPFQTRKPELQELGRDGTHKARERKNWRANVQMSYRGVPPLLVNHFTDRENSTLLSSAAHFYHSSTQWYDIAIICHFFWSVCCSMGFGLCKLCQWKFVLAA